MSCSTNPTLAFNPTLNLALNLTSVSLPLPRLTAALTLKLSLTCDPTHQPNQGHLSCCYECALQCAQMNKYVLNNGTLAPTRSLTQSPTHSRTHVLWSSPWLSHLLPLPLCIFSTPSGHVQFAANPLCEWSKHIDSTNIIYTVPDPPPGSSVDQIRTVHL